MNIRSSGPLMVFLLAWHSAGEVVAAPPEIPPDMMQAWQNYLNNAHRISGKAVSIESTLLDGKEKYGRKVDYEIGQSRVGMKIHRKASRELAEAVYIVNPNYACEVNRNIGATDWYLKRLDIKRPSDFEGSALRVSEEVDLFAQMPVAVMLTPLPDLVRLPTFTVQRVARERYQSADCLRIVFRNPHPTPSPEQTGRPDFVPQSGSILVDPRIGYLIKHAELNFNQTGGIKAVYVFKHDYDTNGAIPLLVRTESTKTVRTSDGTTLPGDRTVIDYTLTLDKSYSGDEFSLRHYGLPEPGGLEVARSPGYHWWFGGAAVVALALAYAFRRAAARRRAAAVQGA